MTHSPWAPPDSPAPFSSPPTGRSAVARDEPAKNRTTLALIVVGCLVAAALAGGVLLLTHESDSASTTIDTVAATSTSSSTTTTAVIPGGVEFLRTRSPVDGSGMYVDVHGLSVGDCFNVRVGNGQGVAEPLGCEETHYYQLFAVGDVPSDITDYSHVDEHWLQFCADKFARFVGVSYLNSRFYYTGAAPASWEFPLTRTMTCFLYVPGEFGWIGNANQSSQ